MQPDEGIKGPEQSGHRPTTRMVGASLGTVLPDGGVEEVGGWVGDTRGSVFGFYSALHTRIYPEDILCQARPS
jgi:hypothetical protein